MRTANVPGMMLCLVAVAGCWPARATDAPLLRRDLAGDDRREVLLLTVDYGPGGASLPHRHDAQLVVYVLEGEVRMQVDGAPEQRLGPGQVFYEGPGDVHRVSANASDSHPARLLVFMIKDKAKPVTLPVPGRAGAP